MAVGTKSGVAGGSMEQTGLSVMSEAALEYCRVTFDLFPGEVCKQTMNIAFRERSRELYLCV